MGIKDLLSERKVFQKFCGSKIYIIFKIWSVLILFLYFSSGKFKIVQIYISVVIKALLKDMYTHFLSIE